MQERIIDKEIKLIPYYRNDEVSLMWYQHVELVKQVDNIEEVYDLDRLHKMYDYISSNGSCYYIEYNNMLVGDVTLKDDGEIAIVVSKDFQNKHIGRRCINEMKKLAKEKNMVLIKANIYSFNNQSKSCFKSVGFKEADDEWYEFYV